DARDRTSPASKIQMLNGVEIVISLVFALVLLLMSIIEVAFGSVNKISVRRLADGPRGRNIPQLTAWIENRSEVSMSINIAIQLLLVGGAVFLFAAFGR